MRGSETPAGSVKALRARWGGYVGRRWYVCAFSTQNIRLPTVVLQEKTTVDAIVSGEQVHVLESVIVRNMKTRKEMTHLELVTAVMGQCVFFRPDPRKIKQRIEDLIKREYMRRNDDLSGYVYMPGEM